MIEAMPSPEKMRENIIKQETEKFFTKIEGAFVDEETGEIFESLKKVRELRSHSPVHFEHLQEVVLIANRLGVRIGLNECDLNLLTEAALLHDVGKVCIDTKILEGDELTDEEYDEVKRHIEHGVKFIKKDYLVDILVIVAMHHEFKRNKDKGYRRGYDLGSLDEKERRFGGVGASEEERKEYDRLKKLAKILSVVDVLQAMLDEKRYHKSKVKSVEGARELIKKELDLEENDEVIVNEVILAMQESGKYFKDESDNISMVEYHLRYKGDDYFTFLGGNF